eukprot:COSAG06_NODE_21464_length_755_cov_24.699695_1_plen_163_part_10
MSVPRAAAAAEMAALASSPTPSAAAAAEVGEVMAQLAALCAAAPSAELAPRDVGAGPRSLAPASSRLGGVAAPALCGGGLVLLPAEGRMVLCEDLCREEARPVSAGVPDAAAVREAMRACRAVHAAPARPASLAAELQDEVAEVRRREARQARAVRARQHAAR